jgi:hypothetical protein
MAFTAADVTALERAIADGRGARSITFADQTIVFNSLSEMLQLLATMRSEITSVAGTSQRTRYGAFDKGL